MDPLDDLHPDYRREVVAAVGAALGLNTGDATAIVRASLPLWVAMEEVGGLVDSWGGGEFCYLFPKMCAVISPNAKSRANVLTCRCPPSLMPVSERRRCETHSGSALGVASDHEHVDPNGESAGFAGAGGHPGVAGHRYCEFHNGSRRTGCPARVGRGRRGRSGEGPRTYPCCGGSAPPVALKEHRRTPSSAAVRPRTLPVGVTSGLGVLVDALD